MAKNGLGMLVGAALDRRDGDSGVKGAVAGYLLEGAVKTIVPLAVTVFVGWAALRGARRALERSRAALGGTHSADADPDPQV